MSVATAVSESANMSPSERPSARLPVSVLPRSSTCAMATFDMSWSKAFRSSRSSEREAPPVTSWKVVPSGKSK